MSFTIYPAIDIRGGKCVRLFQGNYNMESQYYDDPVEPARNWYQAGAEWLHIIDLDGARTGKPENIEIIKRILEEIKVNIQIGGGIRSLESVQAYLENGARRVILGSAALKNIELVEKLINQYGSERIIVSLDGKKNYVYSEGWLTNAEKNLLEVATNLAQVGVKTFIYTDIEKDGTLSGPNVTQGLNIAAKTNSEVIIAGGIGSNQDVIDLKKFSKLGITGVIIGRALYTGDVDLKKILNSD